VFGAAGVAIKEKTCNRPMIGRLLERKQMIHFLCPTCHKDLEAPDNGAGSKTHCPGCGQRLLVPPPVQTQARNKTVLGQQVPSALDWLEEGRDTEKKTKPSSAPQQPSGHAVFKCPTCHSPVNVVEQMIGHMVACPKCQTSFAALSESVRSDSSANCAIERGPNEKYCYECGVVIRARAEICPSCGVRQRARFGNDLSLEPHRGTAILSWVS
jgi:DNA-directed RNA polymerase subunit RPC12/RpoP